MVLLLVIIISLVPHLCVIIAEWIFSLVGLIKEIRDRYLYVPGFDRFSLNCMAHAASHY